MNFLVSFLVFGIAIFNTVSAGLFNLNHLRRYNWIKFDKEKFFPGHSTTVNICWNRKAPNAKTIKRDYSLWLYAEKQEPIKIPVIFGPYDGPSSERRGFWGKRRQCNSMLFTFPAEKYFNNMYFRLVEKHKVRLTKSPKLSISKAPAVVKKMSDFEIDVESETVIHNKRISTENAMKMLETFNYVFQHATGYLKCRDGNVHVITIGDKESDWQNSNNVRYFDNKEKVIHLPPKHHEMISVLKMWPKMVDEEKYKWDKVVHSGLYTIKPSLCTLSKKADQVEGVIPVLVSRSLLSLTKAGLFKVRTLPIAQKQADLDYGELKQATKYLFNDILKAMEIGIPFEQQWMLIFNRVKDTRLVLQVVNEEVRLRLFIRPADIYGAHFKPTRIISETILCDVFTKAYIKFRSNDQVTFDLEGEADVLYNMHLEEYKSGRHPFTFIKK